MENLIFPLITFYQLLIEFFSLFGDTKSERLIFQQELDDLMNSEEMVRLHECLHHDLNDVARLDTEQVLGSDLCNNFHDHFFIGHSHLVICN
jgi:hypothetical protein